MKIFPWVRSEEFELSKSYLNLIFQKATGHTPHGLFQELKMKEARKPSAPPNSTSTRSAQRLGYQDPYYFSRIFRKVVGVADGVSGEGERAAGYVSLFSLETIHAFEGRITVVSHNRGAALMALAFEGNISQMAFAISSGRMMRPSCEGGFPSMEPTAIFFDGGGDNLTAVISNGDVCFQESDLSFF
ncbi:MAG: helix-turn-helix domain-containing protein [Lachnospiraceae bacterium]